MRRSQTTDTPQATHSHRARGRTTPGRDPAYRREVRAVWAVIVVGSAAAVAAQGWLRHLGAGPGARLPVLAVSLAATCAAMWAVSRRSIRRMLAERAREDDHA